jgi:hypothetical protein
MGNVNRRTPKQICQKTLSGSNIVEQLGWSGKSVGKVGHGSIVPCICQRWNLPLFVTSSAIPSFFVQNSCLTRFLTQPGALDFGPQQINSMSTLACSSPFFKQAKDEAANYSQPVSIPYFRRRFCFAIHFGIIFRI